MARIVKWSTIFQAESMANLIYKELCITDKKYLDSEAVISDLKLCLVSLAKRHKKEKDRIKIMAFIAGYRDDKLDKILSLINPNLTCDQSTKELVKLYNFLIDFLVKIN